MMSFKAKKFELWGNVCNRYVLDNNDLILMLYRQLIFDIAHVLDITHKGRKCYNLFLFFFLTGDERAWHGFIDIVFSSRPVAAVTSSELIGKILNIWKKKSYFRYHTVTIVFDSLGSLKYTTVLETN